MIIKDNPKGFNPATLAVIDFLNGDRRSGKCLCPCHDDGRNPSLLVKNGDKVEVILHCHGRNSKEHNLEIIDYLRQNGVWPSSDHLSGEKSSEWAEQNRSPEERRRYAVRIWNDLRRSSPRFVGLLEYYLTPRGIKQVPKTARIAMPIAFLRDEELGAYNFAMVLPVRNKKGRLQGIHVIWLNADLTAKREDEPQRQSYGSIKGNFVELVKWDWDKIKRLDKLLIGEGAETTLAAMQLTQLPGISTGGKVHQVEPPEAKEYIILVDCDEDGASRKAARALAKRLMAPDVTIRIATPTKPDGGKKGFDWNDALLAKNADEAALRQAIIEAPLFETDEEDEEEEEEDKKAHDKQALVLFKMVPPTTPDGGLFRTSDHIGFADIIVAGHRETMRIRSTSFRRWLVHQFYFKTGGTPTGEAVRAAIEMIEAQAQFGEGIPVRAVHVRVGGHAGKIYIDLCDSEWRAVEIAIDGWRIVTNPPVRFRRASGMLPLPEPTRGGSVEKLRSFVNVASDDDFVLLVSWMLAALRDCGPYPILKVWGEPGTAKSSSFEMIRSLIDPHKVPKRRLPRDERDLFIAASNGYVLSYDNISQLSEWLSNSFCNLATGGGFGTRSLYTDQDETLLDAIRPIMLNGITNFITQHDFAERTIVLELPLIPRSKRRLEKELKPAFDAERPAIFGALLQTVAHGLKTLPEATSDKGWSRMADFEQWGMACEGALWEPGTFKAAYAANRKQAVSTTIDDDPVASAIRALVTGKEWEWEGTVKGLLLRLTELVGEKQAQSKSWPSEARALSTHLQNARAALRRIGIHFKKGKRTRFGYVLTITYKPGERKRKEAAGDVHNVHNIHSSFDFNDKDDERRRDSGHASKGDVHTVSHGRSRDNTLKAKRK
jgi:Toprim domain